MVRVDSSLEKKIRETLCNFLRSGQKVAALKFYHDVTMTPLLESKQFIDSLQLNSSIPIGGKKFYEFLTFLEEGDFGGAASRLLDDPNPPTPSDAIKNTLRIAKLLSLDVTSLELPSSVGIAICESTHAQAIITDRALHFIRERMIQNLMQRGTGRDEAEKLIDEANVAHLVGNDGPTPSLDVALDGLDPQLARSVQLLRGPFSNAANTPSHQETSVTTSPTRVLTNDSDSSGDRFKFWSRRIGKLAALAYGLVSIIGVAVICYSYFNIPQQIPFSMPENLSLMDQAARIENWSAENMPTNWRWFNSSVSDHFSPVLLEPGLPLGYAGEEWSWEKKIASINASSSEIVAETQRCHEALLVLYAVAISIAAIHWFQRDIVSGILMVLLAVLGIPQLVSQFWRWEFDNPLWLGPLVLPGMIAFVTSILDLKLVTANTNRQTELRAFWLATLALVISGLFLCWSIFDGNHLRPGAGLGFFGGAWLMLHHGRRYLGYAK